MGGVIPPQQKGGGGGGCLLFASLAFYLQVIDVFLSIEIDALGFLLNGHDRETHVNAAM